jgi:hypothetical protein
MHYSYSKQPSVGNKAWHGDVVYLPGQGVPINVLLEFLDSLLFSLENEEDLDSHKERLREMLSPIEALPVLG